MEGAAWLLKARDGDEGLELAADVEETDRGPMAGGGAGIKKKGVAVSSVCPGRNVAPSSLKNVFPVPAEGAARVKAEGPPASCIKREFVAKTLKVLGPRNRLAVGVR